LAMNPKRLSAGHTKLILADPHERIAARK